MSDRTLQQLRDLLNDHADLYADLATLERDLGTHVSAFRDAGEAYTESARRLGADGDPVFFFALEAGGGFLSRTLAEFRGNLSALQELAALATACAEAGDRLQTAWAATEARLRTLGLLDEPEN